MMGERTVAQEELFYGFSLERHVPDERPIFRISASPVQSHQPLSLNETVHLLL